MLLEVSLGHWLRDLENPVVDFGERASKLEVRLATFSLVCCSVLGFMAFVDRQSVEWWSRFGVFESDFRVSVDRGEESRSH